MGLFFDFVRTGLAAGKTAPISLLLRDGKKTKNTDAQRMGLFFDFVRTGLAAGKTAPISLLLRDGKKTKNTDA